MKPEVMEVEIKPWQNYYYYAAGLAILALNKVRHTVKGYTSPRDFAVTEHDKAIEYDLEIVEKWLAYLAKYTNGQQDINNKNILELGPGADLGIGLALLAKGAAKYQAIDVHDLVKKAPAELYEKLFKVLAEQAEIEELKRQLVLWQDGQADRLNYICHQDFDVSIFTEIDIVFSNAAFEHFDDVAKTIEQLSQAIKPGGLFLAMVDFKTHTRWIKDVDPLNIYRYGNLTYNFFKFSGTPNRVRLHQYEELLAANGWQDIEIIPLEIVSDNYLNKVNHKLHKNFRGNLDEMAHAYSLVCATKK